MVELNKCSFKVLGTASQFLSICPKGHFCLMLVAVAFTIAKVCKDDEVLVVDDWIK